MPDMLGKIASAASKMGSSMVAPPTGEAAGIKARKDNIDEYMKATAKVPEEHMAEPVSSNYDKIHPKSKYGDRSGEKRIDVSEMTKPLPTYHKGIARVPKTGPANLEEGEAVIPKEANPMNHGGTYDLVKGMGKDEKPKKEISHMVHRKKESGHVIEHHHTHPDHHPMEEHAMSNMDDVHDHMEEHMGTPNPGEAEADKGMSGIPGEAGGPPQGGAPTGEAQ
jgi:hypothetical protein